MTTQDYQLKEEGYKVFLDDVIESVCLKWKGHLSSDIYQQSLTELLNVIQKHPGYKILLDTSDITYLSKNDQQWTRDKWMPQIMKILKPAPMIAYILSKSFYNREAVAKINEQMNSAREYLKERYFNNLPEARAWLFNRAKKD